MSNPSCWYCRGDPPHESGPCEACDERLELCAKVDALKAERHSLETYVERFSSELDFSEAQVEALMELVREARPFVANSPTRNSEDLEEADIWLDSTEKVLADTAKAASEHDEKVRMAALEVAAVLVEQTVYEGSYGYRQATAELIRGIAKDLRAIADWKGDEK